MNPPTWRSAPKRVSASVTPTTATVHTTASSVMPHAGCIASSVTGVYEPAISTKIMAWSAALHQAAHTRCPVPAVIRGARAEERSERSREADRRNGRRHAAAQGNEEQTRG